MRAGRGDGHSGPGSGKLVKLIFGSCPPVLAVAVAVAMTVTVTVAVAVAMGVAVSVAVGVEPPPKLLSPEAPL